VSLGVHCYRAAAIQLPLAEDIKLMLYPIVQYDVVHLSIVVEVGFNYRVLIVGKCSAFHLHRFYLTVFIDDKIERVLVCKRKRNGPAVL